MNFSLNRSPIFHQRHLLFIITMASCSRQIQERFVLQFEWWKFSNFIAGQIRQRKCCGTWRRRRWHVIRCHITELSPYKMAGTSYHLGEQTRPFNKLIYFVIVVLYCLNNTRWWMNTSTMYQTRVSNYLQEAFPMIYRLHMCSTIKV